MSQPFLVVETCTISVKYINVVDGHHQGECFLNGAQYPFRICACVCIRSSECTWPRSVVEEGKQRFVSAELTPSETAAMVS